MGKNIDKSLQQISLSESKTKTHMGRLYDPKKSKNLEYTAYTKNGKINKSI